MEITVRHAGSPYTIGGLGNVLTYPGFRRRGFGRIVVGVATDYLDASTADVGCLFCAPKLIPFYSACGWIPVTDAHTMTVEEDRLQAIDGIRMMRFISDHGHSGRHNFLTRDLHLDYLW
jgi:predicted acetyltransferase